MLAALGHARVSVVAQSIGGLAALRMALDSPELVDKLVLNATQATLAGAMVTPPGAGRLGASIWQEYYGGTGPSLEKMRHLIEVYEWFDPRHLPLASVERRFRSSTDPEVVAIAADLGRRGEPEDLLCQLDRIRAETLLVWGQGDAFGGLDVALLMVNRLPDAQLHVLPRAGHHPQEEVPHRYVPLVGDFLSRPGPDRAVLR